MVADNERRKELTSNYIAQAKNSMNSAEVLLNKNRSRQTVQKIFDSMYFMLLALGMHSKFEAKDPIRLINWFKKKYINEGVFSPTLYKVLLKAYQNKPIEDLESYFRLTDDEIKELYTELEGFINQIQNFIFPKQKRGRKPKVKELISKPRRGRKPKFLMET